MVACQKLKERHISPRVSPWNTQEEATNDTLALIPAALHGVARTWREQGSPPWRYSKAGVVKVDLVPLAVSQRALSSRLYRERSTQLMGAMDAPNARFGRGSVVPARAGLERQRRAWTTKFKMRTPRYTTQVDELPIASADASQLSLPQKQPVSTLACHR